MYVVKIEDEPGYITYQTRPGEPDYETRFRAWLDEVRPEGRERTPEWGI